WNSNKTRFYTDSGTTERGYVGTGVNNDFTLVSKTPAAWLRIGSNGGEIGFYPDGQAENGGANPVAFVDVNGFNGDGSHLTNVSGANLQAGSIDSTKLAASAVNTTAIAVGAVQTAK